MLFNCNWNFLLFWTYFKTHNMREIGAIIGLTIGYMIKYKLDKNFVFNTFKEG